MKRPKPGVVEPLKAFAEALEGIGIPPNEIGVSMPFGHKAKRQPVCKLLSAVVESVGVEPTHPAEAVALPSELRPRRKAEIGAGLH